MYSAVTGYTQCLLCLQGLLLVPLVDLSNVHLFQTASDE